MRGRLLPPAVAVIALAGCGTTRTLTQTATVAETTTQTITVASKARRPPTKTATVTVTNTVTRKVSASPASTASGASSGKTFSGNGTENVGTITVASQSTIEWSCSGCAAFALTSDVAGTTAIDIGSKASSGQSAVDPGTYTNVNVISDGDWAFRIVPG